jgi:pimeloyl-ACP methyl ester carboxylesterase
MQAIPDLAPLLRPVDPSIVKKRLVVPIPWVIQMKLPYPTWIGCALGVTLALPAQDFAPPLSQAVDEATLQAIEAKSAKLDRAVAALRRQGVRDPWLAEVQIYHKAASWIVRHKEFYAANFAQWTLDALDRGHLRASQLAAGETPWVTQFGQAVVRAFRSRIDGSVQPYAVTWPKDYGKDPGKKWRVDVVLHGRDTSLTESKFLHQHAGDQPAPAYHFVKIDIFGRGNNAYRWAGETDVLEAIDGFFGVERLLGRAALLDPSRVVLRGFSMGGAGTWHLGLHRPDRWCVLGPGAGFTTTRGYAKDLPDRLPDYVESCLHIYDAVDYAENALNVPVVAYGGANDPQLQAARNIEARLKPLSISMKLLVAPGLAHQFPPEWQQKAEAAYAPYANDGIARTQFPKRVRFVTYTLKYPSCYWVEILALDRHYEKALVDANRSDAGLTVTTKNVRELRLAVPEVPDQPLALTIDGQQLQVQPHTDQGSQPMIYLERVDKSWRTVLPQKIATRRLRTPRKIAGLQGPIDDAFTDSFLCVRGTGKTWHEATYRYAEDALQRFGQEWDKYLRGKLPIKDDADVTNEDIAGKHLVLFGDPASNSLIGQMLDGLPLKWTASAITLEGGKTFSATNHVPVMIYPSPLNAGRYVVLNSGHTFHAADFRGTNALLYPRLGDYAVLKLKPAGKGAPGADVVLAGLFDDHWRMNNP